MGNANFYLISLFFFFFGLVSGSFLNCVIYRLEKEKSFLRGRSFCPLCKHSLFLKDLIPVFSFVFLKGKCRYCRQRISLQYPLVEIATGILFLLIVNYELGIRNYEYFILDSLFLIFISCFLIIIFVYDLKHYIIPDKIIYPAIFLTFIYRLFRTWNFKDFRFANAGGNLFGNWKSEIGNSQLLFNPLISAILASAFFLLIFLLSRGHWIGFGDVKLTFLIGLLLGFPKIIIALFSAFFSGAIMGIGLIVFGKKGLKSEVPFGPFLTAGTFIALFFGPQIINWYLRLL